MSFDSAVEIQWLQDLVLPKILNADSNQYKIAAINLRPIGADEAFMLTRCYRAEITYAWTDAKDREKDEKSEKLQLVVKKTPDIPPEIYDDICFRELFSNEIVAYSQIINEIEKFTDMPFNTIKLLYHEQREYYAAVVLEDFGTKKWRMCPVSYNLSLDHLLLSVKYLAHFHGIAFAMKHVAPASYKSLASGLQEARFGNPITNPAFVATLEYGLERLEIATLKYAPEVKREFIEQLKRLLQDPYKYCKQLTAVTEPMSVLCHGDYLRNNIAFRYAEAEQDKEAMPMEVMMFDLQTMRICSPMIDLSCLMGLSAFAATRQNHFDTIFGAYCSELAASYLAHTNEKVLPTYLSQESLLREYIRYLPYCIHLASYFLKSLVEPIFSSSEEMLSDMKSDEEFKKEAMTQGGEPVDRELAAQVRELYDLAAKYNIDITNGFL